jgi:uncharacterized protein (DUF433 family)
MAQPLSTAEVVALTGIEERRVRKYVEYGVVESKSPPRFELPDIVYFRALAELGLELDVAGRRLLHERIAGAFRAKPLPRRVPLSGVLELKLDEIVEVVTKTLARFEKWKGKLVQDDAILAGEPVFPKSRLAVRQIGGMLLKGAPIDEVKEDDPQLDDEDLELAKLFTVAYPRVGRPREAASR